MSVLADAGKNIEDLPAVGTGVLHAIRRHEWQPEFRSEIDQRFIDALFVAQEMALDLDVDIVATEEVDKKLDPICPTLGSARALVRQLPDEARALPDPNNAINPLANPASSSQRTRQLPFSLRRCACVSSSHKFL